MLDMGMKGTKWTIFTVSVNLFASEGYNNVSVRDIAIATGIKAASIYNHFSSKDRILQTIYDYYNYYYKYFMPELDDLMSKIGTEHPVTTLKRALFRFDPSIQDLMDKIFLIASVQLYSDSRAQDMIFTNIFVFSEQRISALLNKMIDDGIIEPLDIDSFILTLNSLCHSAALRMRTKFPIDWVTWSRAVESVYAMVKTKIQ